LTAFAAAVAVQQRSSVAKLLSCKAARIELRSDHIATRASIQGYACISELASAFGRMAVLLLLHQN
jgi:hypothetical protein